MRCSCIVGDTKLSPFFLFAIKTCSFMKGVGLMFNLFKNKKETKKVNYEEELDKLTSNLLVSNRKAIEKIESIQKHN